MSSSVLREAAQLMRSRAEGATGGHWSADFYGSGYQVNGAGTVFADAHCLANDANHVASWHPVVALAVAHLMDRTADGYDQWYGVRAACRELDQADAADENGHRCECAYKDCYEHGKWHNCTHSEPDIADALAVARAYLGGDR